MKKLDIDLQKLKNQYTIVGKNKALDTALLTAVQVAPTEDRKSTRLNSSHD